MRDEQPRRWLGRGAAPSQPAPAHLRAGQGLDSKPRTRPPSHVLALLAVALLAVLGAGALIIQQKTKPKVLIAKPAMSAFAQRLASFDPLERMLDRLDDGKLTTDILTIEKVWISSCERSGKGLSLGVPCDRQPIFERALAKAVLQGADCMPEKPKEETISFALEVNYKSKTTRLFAGRSGTIQGVQAKPILACVQRFLSTPDWEGIPHDHTRYVVGVLARYPVQKRQ